MGMWRYKCTNCGHNEIETVMSRDRCTLCRRGQYAKFEYMPDEYMNDLKGRAYRTKLRELKRKEANGEINHLQYLMFKEDLDKTFPNPKVDWRRLPDSFKQTEGRDEYDDEPEVNIIHVPHVRAIDENTIGISTKQVILGKDGEPIKK